MIFPDYKLSELMFYSVPRNIRFCVFGLSNLTRASVFSSFPADPPDSESNLYANPFFALAGWHEVFRYTAVCHLADVKVSVY